MAWAGFGNQLNQGLACAEAGINSKSSTVPNIVRWDVVALCVTYFMKHGKTYCSKA